MTDYITRRIESIAQGIEDDYEQLRREMRQWRDEHGWIMRPVYRGRCRATIRRIRAAIYVRKSWEAIQ